MTGSSAADGAGSSPSLANTRPSLSTKYCRAPMRQTRIGLRSRTRTTSVVGRRTETSAPRTVGIWRTLSSSGRVTSEKRLAPLASSTAATMAAWSEKVAPSITTSVYWKLVAWATP
jgi:hypothetical protein